MSAAAREREELHSLLRAAEAGEHGEARHLREQLAAEKRWVSVSCLVVCVCKNHRGVAPVLIRGY